MSQELLREYIELLLSEDSKKRPVVKLKVPRTQEEKSAFMKLVVWVGEKLQAPIDMVRSAIEKARREQWDDSIELVRDYYVMKGIPFVMAA